RCTPARRRPTCPATSPPAPSARDGDDTEPEASAAEVLAVSRRHPFLPPLGDLFFHPLHDPVGDQFPDLGVLLVTGVEAHRRGRRGRRRPGLPLQPHRLLQPPV